MAKENNKSTGNKSILEQSRVKCDKYMDYNLAVQKASDEDNPDNSGVVKLAQELYKERELSPERERISKPENYELALESFNLGYRRTGVDFESFVGNNLKTIIKGLSPQSLEALLVNIELGEGRSKELIIHKDFQELYKSLVDYSNKDAENYEEKREQALEYMRKRLNSFYDTNYSSDKERLKIMKKLSAVDQELKIVRTKGFAEDKKKQLIEKTRDRLPNYLERSAKEKMPFYVMACNVGRKPKRK